MAHDHDIDLINRLSTSGEITAAATVKSEAEGPVRPDPAAHATKNQINTAASEPNESEKRQDYRNMGKIIFTLVTFTLIWGSNAHAIIINSVSAGLQCTVTGNTCFELRVVSDPNFQSIS